MESRKVSWTDHFQEDYKKLIQEGRDIVLLDDLIRKLAHGEKLDEKYQDHKLKNDWTGHRECLILPDWFLVYRVTQDSLILTITRPGFHEDLFGTEDSV